MTDTLNPDDLRRLIPSSRGVINRHCCTTLLLLLLLLLRLLPLPLPLLLLLPLPLLLPLLLPLRGNSHSLPY